jgi:hypothetical protein
MDSLPGHAAGPARSVHPAGVVYADVLEKVAQHKSRKSEEMSG